MSGLETTVINRQRKVVINRAELKQFLDRVIELVPAGPADAWTVCLVSDRHMRELNREFRSEDHATDVLSFPGGGESDPDGSVYLGDVVISAPKAERQARRAGHTLGREIKALALHGYLHLLGFDHETDDGHMMRLQRRLERELIDSGNDQ